jgi:SAM-dependent methyltransferase
MTETSRLSAVRASYDAVAVDYARLLAGVLEAEPLDRAMLGAFAEYVRADGGGAVADLGCGPGRITAYLDGLGIRAFGVDLSPAMVAVARMASLDVADGVLGGVVAWYSTVHAPPGELPAVFAEFARVLAPGGHALIAFGAGDERRVLDRAYGHPVDLDVYRTPPHLVADLLAGAGLPEVSRLVREPSGPESGPQAFLLARKPPAA